MPEGSSSEAPVMKPGPSIFRKRRKACAPVSIAASTVAVPPAGGMAGITWTWSSWSRLRGALGDLPLKGFGWDALHKG